MIEDNKYDLEDLVVAALEQKPTDFETAFNDLIVDRIATAVENKKIEIAQQMYNYEPESEEDVVYDEEELDTEEEDNGEET